MKIKDLIEKLQQYHEDMEVLVDGYEGGYDDISHIREMTVQKEASLADYMGEYESADTANNNHPLFKAIILARKSF